MGPLLDGLVVAAVTAVPGSVEGMLDISATVGTAPPKEPPPVVLPAPKIALGEK